MIFGIFQLFCYEQICYLYIEQIFIIQVAPRGDKVNNQDFYLLARTLHFNFECPYLRNTYTSLHNFGKIYLRDIVHYFIFINYVIKSNATWWKKTTQYSVILL